MKHQKSQKLALLTSSSALWTVQGEASVDVAIAIFDGECEDRLALFSQPFHSYVKVSLNGQKHLFRRGRKSSWLTISKHGCEDGRTHGLDDTHSSGVFTLDLQLVSDASGGSPIDSDATAS